MAIAKADGLRKRCKCKHRAKCSHSWWISITVGGRELRYSINKLHDLPASKILTYTDAIAYRDAFRAAVRNGTFVPPGQRPPQPAAPVDAPLTFGDLADAYLRDHVRIPTRRPKARALMELHIKLLRQTQVPVHGGEMLPFGDKRLDNLRRPDVEAIRQAALARQPRAKQGAAGTNRLLSRLRHMLAWAAERGYVGDQNLPKIKLERGAESPRHRRLEAGEEERLLANANPLLRALIIAALETGCRRGELLSLQWSEVRLTQGVIVLPAEKTKTAAARTVPITQRLRQVLEFRKYDAAGEEFGPDDYVFGNEVGEQTVCFRTAWENCRRRARVTGLHFHDLRRETASRLLETPGVALHDVAAWIGHSSVSTTARYLSTSEFRRQQTLKKFEEFRAREANGGGLDRSEPSPAASPVSVSLGPAIQDGEQVRH
jgi:integrase